MTVWCRFRSWLSATLQRSRMESEMDVEVLGAALVQALPQQARFGEIGPVLEKRSRRSPAKFRRLD